jgi:hypothetical protein
MGEVYRARDTRLERDVALKIRVHVAGAGAREGRRPPHRPLGVWLRTLRDAHWRPCVRRRDHHRCAERHRPRRAGLVEAAGRDAGHRPPASALLPGEGRPQPTAVRWRRADRDRRSAGWRRRTLWTSGRRRPRGRSGRGDCGVWRHVDVGTRERRDSRPAAAAVHDRPATGSRCRQSGGLARRAQHCDWHAG